MKLNKFLIISLSVLMLLMMCVAAVAADSNEGSGSIDSNATGDDYTSDEDVEPEVTYGSEDEGSSGGGSNSVPLSNHATSNPLVLLLGALTLVGVCFSNSKK